jgi:hypothetical protein
VACREARTLYPLKGTKKELTTMPDKIGKKKPRHLSKGQRTHVRRLKQAARKEASINNPSSSPAQPVQVHKKQGQS